MKHARNATRGCARRGGGVMTVLCVLLAACTGSPPPTQAVSAHRAGPAPPSAPAAGGAPARWHVVGTEPFWSVRIEGMTLLFATPTDPAGRKLAGSVEREEGALQFRGEDRGRPFALRLVRGECSDGMSDRRYAYRADFEIDGARYRGCADADPAAASRD
ncbi:hypothetical protein [Thermomonas sp. LB-4]|uniref:COG3650 family protein n=1 Tax=Thermomonas sp. LB-4 TaxID=3102790 RepID=UPI002EDB483E